MKIKNKLKIFSILFLLQFTACEPDLEYIVTGYTQKIIVEGSIFSNEYPEVYLTLNNSFGEKLDSVLILKNVIRTAKVTISDGVNEEILTGQWIKNHFPPYVYRGVKLRGVVGKTYHLKVEYGGYTIHAQTTIPEPANIQSFSTQEIPDNDTLRTLITNIDINSQNKSAYRIFTKKPKDKNFTESLFVYNQDLKISGLNSFLINYNPIVKSPYRHEQKSYAVGEQVDIKVYTIDSVSTQFFKQMVPFSTSTGFGTNTFIVEKKELNSNIEVPGYGIWWGAALQKYNIIIN